MVERQVPELHIIRPETADLDQEVQSLGDGVARDQLYPPGDAADFPIHSSSSLEGTCVPTQPVGDGYRELGDGRTYKITVMPNGRKLMIILDIDQLRRRLADRNPAQEVGGAFSPGIGFHELLRKVRAEKG